MADGFQESKLKIQHLQPKLQADVLDRQSGFRILAFRRQILQATQGIGTALALGRVDCLPGLYVLRLTLGRSAHGGSRLQTLVRLLR